MKIKDLKTKKQKRMKMITEFNLFYLLNLRKNLNLEDLFQYYKYIYIYK